MNPQLQAIVNSMKFYQTTYPEDAMIVVTDQEKIIGYLPGKEIDFKLSAGRLFDDVPGYKNTSIYQSLITGKYFREEHDKSSFGIPYIASSAPIHDEEGNIIGAISGVVSNRRLDTLRSTATDLAATTEEVTATSDEIATATNEIALEAQSLSELSGEVSGKIEEINSILSFIREIASQSNLLALNAMIEAARVGDQGRGFAVVASEMRKMSENSKQSSENIEKQLKQILEVVKKMGSAIQQISSNIEKHAASTEQLNAAFVQIAEATDELVRAADTNE